MFRTMTAAANRAGMATTTIVFLFLCSFTALSADSTAFNPVPIEIRAQSVGIPIGTIVIWPVGSNPADWDSWLECNGQAVSQAAYPELFAIVGGKVPDYRAVFLRGFGSQHSYHYGAIQHSSGALGQLQGDAARRVTGKFTSDEFTAFHDKNLYSEGALYATGEAKFGGSKGRNDSSAMLVFDSGRVSPVANENRPVNTAVRYLIRAR